jgi:ribose-phosphate pyrophosphokinase
MFDNELRDIEKLSLFLPYLPHGRADRVFEYGNAFPLDAFAYFCISIFDEVTVIDPHSDVLKEICKLDQVGTEYNEIRLWECFKTSVHLNKNDKVVIVSPDKGAQGKVRELVSYYQQKGYDVNIAFGDKIRDVSTGEIKEINVNIDPHIDIENSTFIIADDICDGGGTFLGLASKLKAKGIKNIELYVTHGIFSKGLNIFRGFYDKIHCYQTVSTYVTTKDILDYNTGKETK